jgi:NAD(P)-dependent dehydrogenase (short-subunit alcohol dehydrogenase family)
LETEDGIERTMALNYFAPFLFTNLLLGILEGSSPSRVVNVSSSAHYRGRLDLNNINGKGEVGIQGMGSYGRSKLALNLFTFELARREERREVTANCLHPGAVRTHMWSGSGAINPLLRLFSTFLIEPEEGAKTSIYLAFSPKVEGITGKYFEKCQEKAPSAGSLDRTLAGKLWDLSLKMTGLA